MKKKLIYSLLIFVVIFVSFNVYTYMKRKADLEEYIFSKLYTEHNVMYECLAYNQREISELLRKKTIDEPNLELMSVCFETIAKSMNDIDDINYKLEKISTNNLDNNLYTITSEINRHMDKFYLVFPSNGFNDILSYEEDENKIKKITFEQKELDKFKIISVLLSDMIAIFDGNIPEGTVKKGEYKDFYEAYRAYMQELPPTYLIGFLYK